MQENIQNISPIKQRILQFVENLGITKRSFYEKTGISRGTLENPTGITEETLTKLFATYPEIDPVWVLLGKGDMFCDKSGCNRISLGSHIDNEQSPKLNTCELCIMKDNLIISMEREIKTLTQFNSLLMSK